MENGTAIASNACGAGVVPCLPPVPVAVAARALAQKVCYRCELWLTDLLGGNLVRHLLGLRLGHVRHGKPPAAARRAARHIENSLLHDEQRVFCFAAR